MDTRPIRNHPLFPPLLIGILSLLGISAILVSALLPKLGAQPAPTRTSVPFKYLLLATETMFYTSTPEAVKTTEFLFVPTGTSETAHPDTPTTPFSKATVKNGVSTKEFFTPTVTITPNPIFNGVEPMIDGTHDGADSHIIRKGNWSSQNNVDATDGTLLVSNTVGNYVAFRFTGYQMGVGYQSSDNAGEITIDIDGSQLTITQLVGNLWNSDELAPGTHYVIITHASGSQVNIDYIEIPE